MRDLVVPGAPLALNLSLDTAIPAGVTLSFGPELGAASEIVLSGGDGDDDDGGDDDGDDDGDNDNDATAQQCS